MREVQTHTIQFRQQVLQWINEDRERNAMDASRQFNIAPSTVRNWVKNEEEIMFQKDNVDRRRVVPLRDQTEERMRLFEL